MRGWLTLWMAALAACGDGSAAWDDAATAPDAARDGAARDGAVTLPDAVPPRADTGPGELAPPYPIVLAHGFAGFEGFAGLDFVNYFYGVREGLAERGEPLVFTPAVDPFNDSESRGRELLAHVERILRETGYPRLNLIGHSQGGLDARYVASVRPDLVASVVTFATPHRGTPVADVIVGLVDDGRFAALVDRLVRLIGAPLFDAAGEETSVLLAMRQLSTPGVEAFNAAHPDQPTVAYYSLTGRTDLSLGFGGCEADDSPPFITRYARVIDTVDPLLDLSEQITDGGLENAPNDGLVRATSARWGRFLGCVPADHLDEVGHLFGDRPGLTNDLDHLVLYADLVAFLRAEGF